MSSCKLKSENFFNQEVFSRSETNRQNIVPCYAAGTESSYIRNAFMLLLSSEKK